MKINAIGFVAIPVTDIPRARKFYEEVIGLTVSDEMMGGRWIEYAARAGKFEGLVWDLLAFTANSEKTPEWKPESFFKRFAQH